MKNKSVISGLLNEMSREQVRAIAKNLNVPRGKEKKDTVQNLTDAIIKDKARFAVMVEIKPQYPDPQNPDTMMPHVFLGKFYTYKDAKVMVDPSASPDSILG